MGHLSLVLGSVPLAFVTVSMANFDIIQMALKKMDPAGKTMTQVGKILAIVSLLLTGLTTLLVCCGLITGGGRLR